MRREALAPRHFSRTGQLVAIKSIPQANGFQKVVLLETFFRFFLHAFPVAIFSETPEACWEESREDRKAALGEAAFLRSLDHEGVNRLLSETTLQHL